MPVTAQPDAEIGDRHAVLDRIPERIDAARPAAMRFDEPVDDAVEFARLLERRIDQHQPALFLRRQLRAERQPAVEFEHAHLDVAGEQLLQPRRVLRMQFDRKQPVLLAQQPADDQRRAGIGI